MSKLSLFAFRPRERALSTALLAAIVLPVSAFCAETNTATLIKQLESSDRDTRREATYQLSHTGPAAKDAVPGLIKALGDEDKQVWSNAVTALANIGPAAEPAIPALIESMDSKRGRSARRQYERSQVILRSAYALSRIGAPAIPALIEALKGEDIPKRAGAAKALGGMEAAAAPALPALIENLSNGDQDFRRELVEALSLIGAPAVKPLTEALASSDAKTREGAALALGQIGRGAGEAGSALLTNAERDQDSAAKAAALGALPRVGAPAERVVPLLLGAIHSNDEQMRRVATNALLTTRSFGERAVSLLVEDLKSPDAGMRQRAAQILGRMSATAKAAIPALIAKAKQEAGEPVYAAALAQIGLPALDPLLKELTAPGEKNLSQKEWIFRAMRDMGSPAMDALVPALDAKEPMVRAGAARSLEGMPLTPSTIRRLSELSADPDANVRAASLRTLALVRSQRDIVIPKLETALQDQSADVRRAAAAGLAAAGAVAKIGPAGLAELLNEPEKATQRSAIEALGGLGAAAAPAVPAVTERLKDPTLQASVLETLGKIGEAAAPAVPQLVELAKTGDETARLGALQALGNIGQGLDSVLPTIYEATRSENRDLRLAAIIALSKAERDDAKLLPVITDALKDESGRVRRVGAEAVKRLGDRALAMAPQLFSMLERDTERNVALAALREMSVRDLPRLVTALQNKDSSVRIFACNSLAKMGPDAKDALPALEKVAAAESEIVRVAAKKAIEKITGAAQAAS